MDAHLRHLLRKYQGEPTSENAMAFTNAYLRVDPPDPEVKLPLSLEQLFVRARQREKLTGEEQVYPDDRAVLFDEVIRLPFDDCMPPEFISNPWEWFYSMLNERTCGAGFLQDNSYSIVALDPQTDTLYFRVYGWVEVASGEIFSTPQNACPFCLSTEFVVTQTPRKSRFIIECQECSFSWQQKTAPGKSRRRFL